MHGLLYHDGDVCSADYDISFALTVLLHCSCMSFKGIYTNSQCLGASQGTMELPFGYVCMYEVPERSFMSSLLFHEALF